MSWFPYLLKIQVISSDKKKTPKFSSSSFLLPALTDHCGEKTSIRLTGIWWFQCCPMTPERSQWSSKNGWSREFQIFPHFMPFVWLERKSITKHFFFSRSAQSTKNPSSRIFFFKKRKTSSQVEPCILVILDIFWGRLEPGLSILPHYWIQFVIFNLATAD